MNIKKSGNVVLGDKPPNKWNSKDLKKRLSLQDVIVEKDVFIFSYYHRLTLIIYENSF